MTDVAEAIPKRRSGAVYAAAILLAVFTALWPLYVWNDAASFRENGSVEGLQSAYLIAATFLPLLALHRPERLTKAAICGIALLYFNLFIRETDVRGTWAEPFFGAFFLHGRMYYLVAILWVAAFGFGLRQFKETASGLVRWLMTPAGIALAIGCGLYVAGDRAEKHWRGHPIEETLDLYACYFILISGYLTFRSSVSPMQLRTAGALPSERGGGAS